MRGESSQMLGIPGGIRVAPGWGIRDQEGREVGIGPQVDVPEEGGAEDSGAGFQQSGEPSALVGGGESRAGGLAGLSHSRGGGGDRKDDR